MSNLINNQNYKMNNFGLTDIQYDLQKKYLEDQSLSILPISDIKEEILLKENFHYRCRFFHLEKFVYEKDIKISYKLKSVFSSLHSINTTLLFKIVSDGSVCNIYIGTKTKDIVKSSKVLVGALKGNFPGTSFHDHQGTEGALKGIELDNVNQSIFSTCKEISCVIGTPSLKDSEEDQFIQGIENLILGMNGKAFSAIFIANPISNNDIELSLDVYEQIYSVLSSEKEFVVTEGTNHSISESLSFSDSISTSTSNSTTQGTNTGTNENNTPWIGKKIWITLVGGRTKGSSSGTNYSTSVSDSKSTSESKSTSTSNSSGSSTSNQKTFTNKKVSNFLERLDKQIERLIQGKGVGFWNVGAYFLSNEEQNSVIAANIYNGVIKGAESNFETSAIKTFTSLNKDELNKIKEYLSLYEIPRLKNFGYLAQAITTDELTVQINLPHKSIVGLDVVETIPFGNNPIDVNENGINIGKLYNYDQCFTNDVILDYNKFTSHIFVTGSTGAGKSNVTYNLIDKLLKKNINFLVIEPAKGEYKEEFGGLANVDVYGTNPQYTNLLRINPFEFPSNIHIYEHIDRFIEILNACWPMEAAMPNLLKEAIEDAYVSKGWLLVESRCIAKEFEYPLFIDLLQSLRNVIENSDFSQEVKSNYEGALVSRIRSMINGLNKLIFTNNCLEDSELFDRNVIVDLSRVASSESKALFMGILFMKLNEYRIANKSESNSKLKHITILEEAHNLLKKTSSEQNGSGANLAGKSVEMISNAIAEMRTYGEGFIIADQAPGLLDMSVIRNTNTKICLRLPDFEDRKLVGNAMNLSEEQIKELASLETGVAAVYQNDWQEAILCKFDKYQDLDQEFIYQQTNNKVKDVYKALDLISKYELTKMLNDHEIDFIHEVIALDFLLKQNWNNSLSSNLLKIDLLKKIMIITLLDKNQSVIIVKYIVNLLSKSNSNSNHILTKIKIK